MAINASQKIIKFSLVRWSETIGKTKPARYTVTAAPATTALTIGDAAAAAVAAWSALKAFGHSVH